MARVATGTRVEKSQAHLARWLPCLGLKIGQLQPGSRHVKRTWLVAAFGGGFGTASGTAKGKNSLPAAQGATLVFVLAEFVGYLQHLFGSLQKTPVNINHLKRGQNPLVAGD